MFYHLLLKRVLDPTVEVLPKITGDTKPELLPDSDWAESTRETINTLPRVSLRAIFHLILILLAGVIPWAVFAKVDETGSATGRLEPKGRVVNLGTPINGKVMTIAVREGELVQKNQPIMELDSELVSAELQQQQQKLAGQQNQLNQLKLLKNQQSLSLLKSQEDHNNTESQIATLQAEISQTKSSIQGLEHQMQQRVLSAPLTGTVFRLPVKKPGAVVQVGEMVAQIAPKDSPLILRGKMSSRESGFLSVGLPVKIKFDAYPFQDYGILPGRLTWISPDSHLVQIANGSDLPRSSQEFYEVEVELERNYIKNDKSTVLLSPGQTATAEIVIRQRRLVDVLIPPFKGFRQGGMQP